MTYGEHLSTLSDVAGLMGNLNGLWWSASQFEWPGGATWTPSTVNLVVPEVQLLSLVKKSPLSLELGFTAETGILVALPLFVHLVRNPGEVAAWLPTFVERWHLKWADAARARGQRDLVGVEVVREHMRALDELSREVLRHAEHLPAPRELLTQGMPPPPPELPHD